MSRLGKASLTSVKNGQEITDGLLVRSELWMAKVCHLIDKAYYYYHYFYSAENNIFCIS